MRETDRRSTRILVDLQACQTLGFAHRGVGRFSKGLFLGMAAAGAPREVYGLGMPHHTFPLNLGDINEARILHAPMPPDWQVARDFEGGDRDSLDDLLHASVVATIRPDVVHISHVFEGFADRCPLPSTAGRQAGQVLSATLYDLIPLRFPEHYFANETFERWYRRRLQWLHQADLLLSISEASRQDAIDLIGLDPDRIVTIHGGISAHFTPVEDSLKARERLRARYGINRKGFVFYTGGDDYRKNLQGAILGYARLPKEVRTNLQLVVVCVIEEHRKELFMSEARKAGLAVNDVLFLGFVPANDLRVLYATCDLFVFPSLYEGLGLPVLEAMACGAPVIGGDNSSIREIIARSDALFDAANPSAIAECMQRVLGNTGFAEDLRHHGLVRAKDFTWKNSAQRALDAFDEALQRKRQAGIRAAQAGWLPRRRIAMLTPLPPAKSGIADYNAQFLPYLARHFEIDLYVDSDRVSDKTLNSAFRIFNIHDFRVNASAYDAILYEFGNSEFHVHMLTLLAEFPGIVVLHDAFLSGMMAYLEFNLGDKDRYAKEMLNAHGNLARRLMAPAQANADPIGASVVSLPCTKAVLNQAIGLISHSPFNLEIARRFHPEGWAGPYRIIPQMVMTPESWTKDRLEKTRTDLGFRSNDIIIASFGHVAWTKLGDRLVEAFLNSELARDENCQLVFVGDLAKDDFGYRLSKRVRKSGLEKRIKITGFLPDFDYERYLRIADIAIQLRTKSRGGTPKGVLDCLAYGVPVIVNNDASHKDYPDDVVFKLAPDPDVEEIARALMILRDDADQRARLAERGRRHVDECHNPVHCAAQYAAAIHEFVERDKAVDARGYARKLAPHMAACPDPTRASRLAADFLDSRPAPTFARPRLFIDVSHVAKDDHKTGVQRVVKETVRAAYCRAHPGLDPIPVVRAGDHLVNATDWLASQDLLLPHEMAGGAEQALVFRPGDHLLMLDSSWDEYAAFQPIFQKAREAGVPITTAIYDLLPVILPPSHFVEGGKEWFEGWVRRAVAESDALVSISKAMADEIIAYITHHGLGRKGLKVGYWHLGSKFKANGDCPANSPVRKTALKPYCLMVGTIEPRKNHALALDAIERLWDEGWPLNLVIAGKPGWLVDDLLKRLRGHKLLNKRLFFFEGCSDDEIAHLYRNATALLLISKGEGFGLPLVEAAHYGTPIICSDIPVFREVAGKHATYVGFDDAGRLVREISDWWARCQAGDVPQSTGMPRLSWEESTEALIDVVVGQNRYWVNHGSCL